VHGTPELNKSLPERWSIRALPLAFLLLGFLLPGTACRKQDKSGITVRCTISPEHPHVGFATVRVALFDSKARPISGRVSLEADMSHPGMSPVFAAVSDAGNGEYQARLNFDMAGDWTLSVHAILADGAAIDKQVQLTVTDK
jgi:hypothetical protein